MSDLMVLKQSILGLGSRPVTGSRGWWNTLATPNARARPTVVHRTPNHWVGALVPVFTCRSSC
jgi:hypothetical protein